MKIAEGMTSEDAGVAVGVSGPVGSRWFRERGGMPLISLDQPSGRYLSFAEREEIALMRARDAGVREIARALGRDPSTISREVRRNAATRAGKLDYRAGVAQWKAELAARRPKPAKLVANTRLRDYVQERLSTSFQRDLVPQMERQPALQQSQMSAVGLDQAPAASARRVAPNTSETTSA